METIYILLAIVIGFTFGLAVIFGIIMSYEQEKDIQEYIDSLTYVKKDDTRYLFNLMFNILSKFYVLSFKLSIKATRFIHKLFKFIIKKQ